jgi:hypothetical protein
MLEVRKNMLSIHLKMFYSYTGGEHKNMFDMFEKFCCRNEIGGYVKEKWKKGKKKKRVEKMDT